MKKKKSELLTEVELEFMNELWALGEGTVRDVLERLPEDRNLAYTSGATILRILEQKGVCDEPEGRQEPRLHSCSGQGHLSVTLAERPVGEAVRRDARLACGGSRE